MTKNKRTLGIQPEKQQKTFWSVSRKLLIPSVALMAVVSLGLIIYIATTTVRRNQAEAERDLSRTLVSVQSSIEQLQTLSLALATEMANNPQVQEAFAAQDRESLTKITYPTFEVVQKEFSVKQYQFILPPATSFLRLHQLEKFGDDLSTFRFTVLAANQDQKAVSGIEIGRGGLGVRGEVPVFHRGEFIGIVDVGLDIGPDFLERLKEQYGIDAQIMLERTAAETATFEGVTSEVSGPTANLLLQVSTFADPVYADTKIYERVLNGETVFSRATPGSKTYSIISAPLKDYSGKVIGILEISSDRTAVVASQFQSLILSILLSLFAAGLGSVALVWFINRTIQPIHALTETAAAVASGDLGRRAAVESNDEFGILADAFNTMVNRLRDLIGSLESRIAERTRNLQLAAEVGRSVSQVRELSEMLKDSTELIRSQFDLYYVQVYLTNNTNTTLSLLAGTGAVGTELVDRGHQLPVNTTSINGRAVVEKRPVVISDTASSATFRPNPLLPNTRSEMAMPLIVGDDVVGVLDMQSEHSGALSDEVLPAFEALAGQLAVAIQNANLLAETEEARLEVEKQAQRLVRAGWQDYLDAIHKPEQAGFVYEGNRVMPLNDNELGAPLQGQAIEAPIALSGETLGSLVVEMSGESQTPQNAELVNIVARQVAQQIENIRLLESAERYRVQAEAITRRSTVEGWKEYIESRPETSLGYMYDLKEVVPAKSGPVTDENVISLPLKARDETIGKLAVMGIEPNNPEALELAGAVVERLGAHIENLRLLEETRRGQLELDKRARELASVAEISSASARELNVQKMLEKVVFLTQRKFGLYHAHVFIFNEQTRKLSIIACGWKEGDEHEGTHGTAVIPIDQEQSLVARAARELKPVMVNDVRSDPAWLPNPLLPDTRSELSVPLLVGDQLLGVLDVQRDVIDGFSEEDMAVQMTLAAQVATAMQNAYSFAQAQRQAERESMLNTISQKIQSATTVEAVLQIAARELGHALGAPLTVAQLGVKGGNGNN